MVVRALNRKYITMLLMLLKGTSKNGLKNASRRRNLSKNSLDRPSPPSFVGEGKDGGVLLVHKSRITPDQTRDRLSFMRFLGLTIHDAVPDEKTIWLFREALIKANAI